MHTFGYAFKPWTGDRAIADGDAIRDYIRETATENGIDGHIRFGHRVVRAEWSSAAARWTVTAERDGATVRIFTRWLFCASGYYRYDEGYTPELPGLERFAGQVIPSSGRRTLTTPESASWSSAARTSCASGPCSCSAGASQTQSAA